MEQKIKDRSDYISPSNMRRSEKMTTVTNSNSSSKFNHPVANKPLNEQELRSSFQDNMEINLFPEVERDAVGIKANKNEGTEYSQLLETDKVATR